MDKKYQHKTANATIAFAVLLVAILSASSSFANVSCHHSPLRSKTTYPGATGETNYTYDLADRLKTAAENNITATRSFDARGRETQRAYSGGSLNKTLYGYDGNGNLISETVTDNTGTRTTYTQYDAFDRPERVTDAYGNLLIHAYDANGNRSQTTAPGISGNQVSRYTWDANDNLVSLATGNAVINWQYDRSGKVTRTTYPGGTVTDQTWDNAARLQTRSHKAAGGQQSFAYTYDKNGNRSQETRNLGAAAETISYTYDADDRLTGVQGSGWSETYVLDSTGNRKQTTRSGYGAVQNTFDERGQLKQRQTPAETVTYIWDQAGNLSQSQSGGQTTTYTWDGEHQLIEIKQNGTTLASYRYTGGLRDQSQSVSGNYRTVWDGGFAFIEQDSSGQTLTRTEHAADKAIYLTGTSGNEVLLRDGLDSVTGSIANGALQSSTAYSAWGEASQTGATQSNHGYTGHLKDDTGLIYAKARYYDPGIGRFISKDPLEGLQDSPITWNAYLYGNGNPFYYVDPTGQDSVSTMIDKAAEGCSPWSCAGWAFLYGAYQVSTAGFASVHDPVRDAYDEGSLSGSDYAAKGIGGGLAVAGISLATARVGGAILSNATNIGGRVAGAAAVGSITAQTGDALTQGIYVSSGIQEGFDYERSRNAALVGLAGGAATAATAEGLIVARQALAKQTTQYSAVMTKEGGQINTEAVPINGTSSAAAKTSATDANIDRWVKNYVVETVKSRTVFSGHGGYEIGSGITTMPKGTSLTVYSKFGGTISDKLGNMIETSGNLPRVYSRIYMPGERLPNYTLYPPSGLNIKGSPVVVEAPTKISDLLKQGMGECHWAACTWNPKARGNNIMFDTKGTFNIEANIWMTIYSKE